MLLAETVEEILRRADEAFVDASEDRARRCFYVALTNSLRKGEFDDTDAYGFIHERIHAFGIDEHEVTLEDLQDNDYILRLRNDPKYDPLDGGLSHYITKATDEERRLWGIPELRPVYDRVYYQIGNRLIFMPEDVWDNIDIHFEVITAPPSYADSPAPHEWGNNTNMFEYMSPAYLDAIIEAAVALFRQEVIVHDG